MKTSAFIDTSKNLCGAFSCDAQGDNSIGSFFIIDKRHIRSFAASDETWMFLQLQNNPFLLELQQLRNAIDSLVEEIMVPDE